MSEPTLADVIREAAMRYCRLKTTDGPMSAYIAAAVTTWASSDAAVERMARAAFAEHHGDFAFEAMNAGYQQQWRDDARAAVAALFRAREVGGG